MLKIRYTKPLEVPTAYTRALPKRIALREYPTELKKMLLAPVRKLGKKENAANATPVSRKLRNARTR